jgi:hypothetical protein
MTSDRRFEQELPGLLDQLAYGPLPDYRDDIVRQTARTRQRPAWMHPERWLPVTSFSTSAVAAPRVPWRLIVAVALIIAAVAVGAALIAGSRPRIPAPFGLAADGAVAYAANGDIYSVDHATGIATAISSGADWDAKPVYSDVGTKIVFERKDAGGATSLYGRLVVADADGSEPTVITPDALPGLADYAFSPDGTQVMFTAGPDGGRTLWLANADGTGVARELTQAAGAFSPRFLAPAGLEIVFATSGSTSPGNGISAVNTITGTVRTIVPTTPGVSLDWVRPSPDGSRIAYSASTDNTGRNTYRVHVVGADGSNDRVLPMPAGAIFEDAPEWSNDSAFIAVTRGYGAHNEDMVLAVVPVSGPRTGTETPHKVTGCCDTELVWSPDDASILVQPEDLAGKATQQQLWNPLTGAVTTAPWVSDSSPSWQRVGR